MEKKLITAKKGASMDKLSENVESITQLNSIVSDYHNVFPKMGTGSCKLCDCQGFSPSSGGRTCINHNSAGGTCNHYEYEHY